eukprot:CAMPEP_0184369478 /NCGR_PEP_ID=MMETSP1089-20130417/162256_1 /TAXON_ID=38269 ORGANISM="Gloeochaete wittrockiana, Strain SAG46.84" /NCGR_SAMPLE_ID=MMETSP1089 /ASSEMBLY_ACC=CAM_ASM_000445 /LENGTH=227 /DNA_ID=CAMNT_0026711931 /DNA_START=68 /DNA_END=751 /DNA_ORIENTATION=-
MPESLGTVIPASMAQSSFSERTPSIKQFAIALDFVCSNKGTESSILASARRCFCPVNDKVMPIGPIVHGPRKVLVRVAVCYDNETLNALKAAFHQRVREPFHGFRFLHHLLRKGNILDCCGDKLFDLLLSLGIEAVAENILQLVDEDLNWIPPPVLISILERVDISRYNSLPILRAVSRYVDAKRCSQNDALWLHRLCILVEQRCPRSRLRLCVTQYVDDLVESEVI